MRKLMLYIMVLGLMAACRISQEPPEPDIADGPIGATRYVCTDGTTLDYYVQMGGIILVLDDVIIDMPQIWVEGIEGHVHQAGNLGWISGWPSGGELVRIGAGDTIATAPRIPCSETEAPPVIYPETVRFVIACDDTRLFRLVTTPDRATLSEGDRSWDLDDSDSTSGRTTFRGDGAAVTFEPDGSFTIDTGVPVHCVLQPL